ncbi:MAG: hypothetical protein ABIQ12_08150 [Opitutaceae bacterium]
MVRVLSLRLAAFTCLLAASSWGAEDEAWSSLKPGMTRVEAVAMMGPELVGSRGRGFEIAIYDDNAELVFLHGGLVAWTAPVGSLRGPAQENILRFNQQGRPRYGALAVPDPRVAPVKRALFLPVYAR